MTTETTTRAQELLHAINRLRLGLQVAVTDLTRELARASTAVPLDDLATLGVAVDAVGIAASGVSRRLADRGRLAEANHRAAQASLQECQLRLEMLYSTRPSAELEAVMAAVSVATIPSDE